MCGRMNIHDEGLDELFAELVGYPFPGETNHNTAPTESVWIIRNRPSRAPEGGLEAAAARWWLTPYWSKTPKPRYATFNARAETLAESRTFGEPFRRRRCLVPTTGFYEWRRDGEHRQPFHVRPPGGPMILAGVWDRWRSRDRAQVIESFAVVTTAASDGLQFLHDRQPAMLSRADALGWLDRQATARDLAELLAPAIPSELAAVPVSNYVGDPRNKESRCALAVADAIRILAAPL